MDYGHEGEKFLTYNERSLHCGAIEKTVPVFMRFKSTAEPGDYFEAEVWEQATISNLKLN